MRDLMKLTRDKMCSFCGAMWSEENRLIGGFGAQICRECVDRAHEILNDPELMSRTKPPWDDMSIEELLDALPNIVRTAGQVDQFLHEWVQMLHDRGASWQRIGMTLGVSRQAAWERFHRKPDLTETEISG
jgi:ATP-dependent Clp protease ATP-binding subunit ClpX